MPLITIGELARRSGLASSALRYYEDLGLIFSERTGAGHRRFPRATLRRVAYIVYAQRIGFTLREIGTELAKLPDYREPTSQDWARLMDRWSAKLQTQIQELKRLEKGVTQCIGCGCLSLDRCRLANPEDRASKKGPGPRAWVDGKV